MGSVMSRIVARLVTRPSPVLAVAGLLALLGGIVALRLGPDAGADTLVDRGSGTFEATERFKQRFGDDPVVILVKGDLRRNLLTANVESVAALEGCLAGTAPQGQVFPDRPAPDPCRGLASLQPAAAVFGPATFINEAIGAGLELAGSVPAGELLERFGGGIPTRERIVSAIVFDSERGGGVPKARFSALFPSPEAMLISVRLRPGLSNEDRDRAIELIEGAVADPAFALEGGDYVVGGIPVVVSGLGEEIQREIFILLAVAVVVMAAVLVLIFGPPLRLLPLAIALGAAAVAFGLLSAFGGSLTLASIAVLPILIGLGVDYAIQLQARFREISDEVKGSARAAVETASRGGRVIGTAAMATGAGFLVLLISPIPVVRGFGVLLVVGIAVAFGLALTAGLTALSMAPGRRPASRGGRDVVLPAAVRGAGKSALALALRRPGTVLMVALALAAGGWYAATQTEISSDIRELAPNDLAAIESIDELERETGISGELNVVVGGPDAVSPKAIEWMSGFKREALQRHGFTETAEGCRAEGVRLCPGLALSDLFVNTDRPSRALITQFLRLVPGYFQQALLAGDGDGGAVANLTFLIPSLPLDEQKRLVDDVRDRIAGPDGPPPGVEAEVVGLPALAADANARLGATRYWLALAGLGAVALVLLAVRRSPARAFVPLIPIVLATGWSALLVEAIGVPLNPMSVTLGALVIAIATEFSVILSARYEEERAGGRTVGEALRQTYRRTGAAVIASGTTAIAGFAVLIAEALPFTAQIPLLRDFGIVTVVDLSASLLGVLIVLPAALVWAEGGFAPLSRLRRAPTPAPSGAER